jgi:hypothetical protein
MTSPKPDNPAVNDTWVDDVGDLYAFDGEHWVLFVDTPFLEPNSVMPETVEPDA